MVTYLCLSSPILPTLSCTLSHEADPLSPIEPFDLATDLHYPRLRTSLPLPKIPYPYANWPHVTQIRCSMTGYLNYIVCIHVCIYMYAFVYIYMYVCMRTYFLKNEQARVKHNKSNKKGIPSANSKSTAESSRVALKPRNLLILCIHISNMQLLTEINIEYACRS